MSAAPSTSSSPSANRAPWRTPPTTRPPRCWSRAATTQSAGCSISRNHRHVELLEAVLARRPSIQLISAMLGRLGLELAGEHRPDLILLDLHLPDLGGSEILAALRADPGT